jgi:hypothetical protein
VRAAWSPGTSATKFASTTAPTAIATIVAVAIVGCGTTWIDCANTFQKRDADRDSDCGGDGRLPGDDARKLTAAEAERLEQCELVAATAHRRDEREH